MYCKKCGAMISSRQSKCEKCGWEVPQNNQETTSSIGEQALTTPGQNSQVAEKSKLVLSGDCFPVLWSFYIL